MNHQDWVDYFETVNHRKPTQEDILQAYAKGEVSAQVQSFYGRNGYPNTVSSSRRAYLGKKYLWLWITLGAVLALILLSGGGYSIWRYQSGDIRGTWQEVNQYNSDEHRWEKLDTASEKYYLIVNPDKTVQQVGFAGPILSNDYYVTPQTYMGAIFKVNQWQKSLSPTLSKEAYRKKWIYSSDYIDDYVDEDVAFYASLGKKDTGIAMSYKRHGNTLTVIFTKRRTGKVVSKIRYKRLSKSESRALIPLIIDRKDRFASLIKDSRDDDYDDYDDYDDSDYDDDAEPSFYGFDAKDDEEYDDVE